MSTPVLRPGLPAVVETFVRLCLRCRNVVAVHAVGPFPALRLLSDEERRRCYANLPVTHGGTPSRRARLRLAGAG